MSANGPPPRVGPCSGYFMPILRIMGFLCGGTVITLGIYAMVETQDIETMVTNIYRVLFGILIILAEFRLTFLLQWFSFLTFFGGLGAFYIFVGGLALGSAWYEVTLAIVMVCMGVLYLGSACACSEYAHEHQASMSEKVEKSAASGSATVDSSTETVDPFTRTGGGSGYGAGGNGNSVRYQEMDEAAQRKQRLMANENPFGASDEDHMSPSRGAYGANSGGSSRSGAYGQSGADASDNPFAGSKKGAYS